MNQIDTTPVPKNELHRETKKNKECRKFYDSLQSERSDVNSIQEYSLQNSSIFHGIPIVIPSSLQKRIDEDIEEIAEVGI